MGIIAIANNKGGIGKTTSVINIGAALANFQKKVLLIDFDPQANLSKSLGFRDCEQTIIDSLIGEKLPEPLQVKKNLSVLPANLSLTKAEQQLNPAEGDHHLLKELLQPLYSDYDFILIDCPPSLNILTTSALTAAQYMLIPVQAEFLALEGLASFLETIEKIQRRINANLAIAGIFITRFDKRKVLNRHVLETLSERFPAYLLPSLIRENIAIAESPINRSDIFDYAPKSFGAEDYALLARDILHKLENPIIKKAQSSNEMIHKNL